MGARDYLNGGDFKRIEAALHVIAENIPSDANPGMVKSFLRTLDKIERINKTGKYTVQK